MIRLMTFLFLVMSLCGDIPLWSQTRVIRLEVVVGADQPLGLEQEWMEVLQGVGADHLKISKSMSLVAPKIDETTSGQVASVRIIAVVQGRDLYVPNAKFSRTDGAGIRDYIQKIRDDGSQVALADKKAFGLSSEQLVQVSEALAVPYDKATLEEPTEKVVKNILTRLKLPASFEGESQQLLVNAGKVQDEMKGLSAGTVLAAVLRPCGLVLVPGRKPSKPIELRITKSDMIQEFWPVGWPTEGNLSQTAPTLFDRLDINIQDFVLNDAVGALRTRIGLPLIWDRNSLAEKEVDPKKILVTLERKKSPHYLTLDKLLAQAKPPLKAEVRLDEAGRPFLWIY